MISLIYMYILIFFHVIINVHSQGDVLGPSACDCFSMSYYNCEIPDAPIESFPKECSSYLYMFFKVQNNTVIDEGAEYSTIKGYLDQLIKTKTNVLVYYYHDTQKDWCAAVKCDAATQTAEMNNLKSLLDKHPGVKGIVLRKLLDTDTEVTSEDCPDYTQNFKAYIDLMRNTFSNMSIGIVVHLMRAKDLYNNPKLAWLNYACLDASLDFYIINFSNLNACTDDFLKTGTSPLSGNNNSVEAMKTFLDSTGIPSSKVHYTFFSYGDTKDMNLFCDAMPTNYCKNVQNAKTSVCADTLQTLSKKGDYAQKNGVGFVVNTIDSDDFDCSCQCGQSFPAFHAILSGFNGEPEPKSCALFDRT